MTVVVRAVSGPLEDPGIREKVYGGEILVFKSIEAMAEFCSFADGLIREVLDTEDPLRAQFEIGGEDYLLKAEELQRRFRKENRARVLLCEALRSAGVDTRHTFWDRPYLRTSPHSGSEGHQTAALGFHRDTWASNVYSQINWWAPIYPIDAGRTIAFYPEYWQSLLNNTSAEWDLEEIRAGKNLPLVPEPVESVSTVSELRVVLEPGDLLCFSGAHLHASVPNATGVARFSVEVRTASAEDEARGQGASNLDGQAPHRALSWFRHMEDELSLSEALACCGEGEPAG